MIPQYASQVPPSSLVRLLCKGRCCQVRYAQLIGPHPGFEVLKRAMAYDYKATCLWCGKVAADPYNWMSI